MQRGFAPILVVVFIAVMLIGLIIAGYYAVSLFSGSSATPTTNTATSRPFDSASSSAALNTIQANPSQSPLPSTPVPTGYTRLSFLGLEGTTFQLYDQLLVKPHANFGTPPPTVLPNGQLLVQETSQVFLYDPLNKKQQLLYQNNGSGEILKARLSDNQQTLFVTKAAPAGGYQFHITIEVISLPNTAVRTLSNIPSVLYGSLDYLFNADTGDIVGSFGGDGCGGYGKIYQVKDNQITELLKTGAGCVTDPIYLGVVEQQQLILLAGHTYQETNNGPKNDYTKLMSYNVVNKQQSNLLDISGVSSQITMLRYDPREKMIVMVVGKELWKFDPVNKSLQKNTLFDKLPAGDILWQGIVNGRLYGYNYNTSEIVTVDTTTKAVTVIKWTLTRDFPPLFLAGSFSKPLFMVSEYPRN